MASLETRTAASTSRLGQRVPRSWVWALLGLVLIRGLIPLAVLAHAPGKLPLTPSYTYAPLSGDSYGFYEAVADVFAAAHGVLGGWIGLASLALMICLSAAALIVWRGGVRWLAVLLPALGLGLILGVVVHDMAPPGAGVIGWPLLWALALSPLSVFHVSLTPDRAFPAGFAVTLLANAVTVVATALIGFRATGRRSVGLIAAALYASWPLWVGLVAGQQAWQNGQWLDDTGLSLYAEPVSTALVAVAIALLLRNRVECTAAVAAGLLLGFATAVKLTNGPIAAVLLVIVALRDGGTRAMALLLGGLVSVPIVVGYWSNGYVDPSVGGVKLGALYQWRFVSLNARTSTIFTGTMLLVLVPLAVIGVCFAGRLAPAGDLHRADRCHHRLLLRVLRHEPASPLLLRDSSPGLRPAGVRCRADLAVPEPAHPHWPSRSGYRAGTTGALSPRQPAQLRPRPCKARSRHPAVRPAQARSTSFDLYSLRCRLPHGHEVDAHLDDQDAAQPLPDRLGERRSAGATPGASSTLTGSGGSCFTPGELRPDRGCGR